MDWASIPKQTFLVENGEHGDCWRCCVAAVVGKPAGDVPHFAVDAHGNYNHQCDPDTQKWLNAQGYQMVCVQGHGGREPISYPCYHEDLAHFPEPVLISVGPTCRSKGRGRYHAIVTQGREVLYDPHPSNAGLTAVTEQYLIFAIQGFRG